MKTIITALIIVTAATNVSFSQNVNWRSIRGDQQTLLQFNFGYDYGTTAQMSYSRVIPLFKPATVGLDFSFPMGDNLLDDFKVRLGGQIEVLEIGGFSATVRIASIFRRYQSEMVRIESFGSEFALVAGYYAPTWSLGGEFGFDKAITSRLTHSGIMKEMYPQIKDGWYVPTGGHYFYGIQGGKTIGETLDLSLRFGQTSAQADDENAVIPLYFQLGLGVKF
jgi:hypothetical protein